MPWGGGHKNDPDQSVEVSRIGVSTLRPRFRNVVVGHRQPQQLGIPSRITPLWNWLVLNELKGELVNQGHIHSFCFSFEWSLCGQTSVPFNQSHQVLIGLGLGLGA